MEKDELIVDPFTYLKDDHRKVEKLFDKLDDTSEDDASEREDLFAQLNESLTLHAMLEETYVYPVLQEKEETRSIVLEGIEEHAQAKELLAELTLMDKEEEEWTAKLTVLKEDITHHVKEEEHEMFPKAKKALSDSEIEDMAGKMNEYIAENAPLL